MSVLQVSTGEFRANQASFLDMADKGANILIRRGNKAYVLTPVSDDDLYFTPEILACIDKSLEQAKKGKVHKFDSVEDLDKYIKTL